MRLPTLTYVYDDPEHPGRATSAIQSPPYTREDRGLLAGLKAYEAGLCPGGCGQPTAIAWHSDMDGWYQADRFVCHACTARRGDDKKAVFVLARYGDDMRPGHVEQLPEFVLGVTTTDS